MYRGERNAENGKSKEIQDGIDCLCNNSVTENIFPPSYFHKIGGVLIH
jgi:hypothetical protein